MRELPAEWSERIPRYPGKPRRERIFNATLHPVLVEAGFKPAKIGYWRLIDEQILQMVYCDVVAKYYHMCAGSYIPVVGVCIRIMSLNTEPCLRSFEKTDAFVERQQAFTGFRFPGMEADFTPSFLHTYCDDFQFAMECETELFVEQTLPKLNAMCTTAAVTECLYQQAVPDRPHRGINAAFLKFVAWHLMCENRWDDLERLLDRQLKDDPDEIWFWEDILKLVQERDAQTVEMMAKQHYEQNMAYLRALEDEQSV